MMKNAWEILNKELKHYGIALSGNRAAILNIDGADKKIKIRNIIYSLKRRLRENGKVFEETWQSVLTLLEYAIPSTKHNIDDKIKNLFINTVKELNKFAYFIDDNFLFEDEKLQSQIALKTRSALDRDIFSFPKEIILLLPDYKINLDFIYRKMSMIAYVINLLRLAMRGEKKISKYIIKEASGIAGPWSRLDLPWKAKSTSSDLQLIVYFGIGTMWQSFTIKAGQ